MKFYILVLLENLSRKLKFYLNLAIITGPLHEDQYRFLIPSSSVLLSQYSSHLAQKVENKCRDQINIQVYHLHITQWPQPINLTKRRRNTLCYNSKISRTTSGHQAELEGTHRQETETDGSPVQRTSLATWTDIPSLGQQQTFTLQNRNCTHIVLRPWIVGLCFQV
jgi:hypothetical protein